MSQQVFADRLGKSKSWVDKVERGVRSLDKVSTLREIAAVLGLDTGVLLGRDVAPAAVGPVEGVDRVRAALALYEVALSRPLGQAPPVDAGRVAASVTHAWITYQHARYPQLLDLLPGLLSDAQRTAAVDPAGRGPLVDAYRVTAAVLVKLSEADLAWLAADRAMATATGHMALVGAATVQLAQVLRALGRPRLAMTATLTAAHRVAPAEGGPVDQAALCGALLVQAALAAARCGDDRGVAELVDQAAEIADRVGDGHDHHHTGFGPTAVDLSRVAAAVDLGVGAGALCWHEQATRRDAWRWLPPEHRAGHLIDTARAYLQADNHAAAGRVLVDADRTAPAEVRSRPVVREVLAAVVRNGAASSPVLQLADRLGVV